MRVPVDSLDGAAASGAVNNDLIVVTVLYTLMVGIAFVALGYFGRQLWLKAWGMLTVVVCCGYLFAVVLGYA